MNVDSPPEHKFGFKKIAYSQLNARQKENRNYHKVAAQLADYGFNSIRITDDWEGADFFACHVNGTDILRVQLKGRFLVDGKYQNKGIHIAFLDGEACYLYPHDTILAEIEYMAKITSTRSWVENRHYSWPSLPQWARTMLAPYRLNW